MTCRRVEELLSDHIENLLSQREAARVTGHLRACLACCRLRDELLAAGAALRAPLAPRRMPDLEGRIAARWLSERETAASNGHWRLAIRRPTWAARTALQGAAGLLVLAAVLGSGRWQLGRSGPASRPQIAHELTAERIGPTPPSAPQPHVVPTWHRLATERSQPRGEQPPMASAAAPKYLEATDDRQGHSLASPPPPARARDELELLNGNRGKERPRWAAPPSDESDRLEDRVRRAVRVRDDFIQIPLPRLADASGGQAVAAVEGYRREAAIVDPRLAREMTLAVKATALGDLCDQLRSDTGIRFSAGPSVADEKVTLFCEKTPLRDVMRQLSRPFGYTWLRNGKAGEHRYELVQDLRSQLLEEELRNRDRDAALLALDREIERYRKYLDLSPDEAQAQAKNAPPEEKRLLEQLAGTGWGAAQMYFRLSPADMAALRAGRSLIYGGNVTPDPLGGPSFVGKRTADGMDLVLHTLPSEVALGTLQGLRGWRVRPKDGRPLVGDAQQEPDGVLAPSSPLARPAVMLRMQQNDLGEYLLIATSGLALSSDSTHYILNGGGAFAVGVNPAAAHPDNQALHAKLAHDPALQPRVTVQPRASCALAVGPGVHGLGANPGPRLTTADLLEELHRATHMPIVADYYTRLQAPADLSLRNTRLFEALNRLADNTRTRWAKEGGWLRFRSAGFYNDRLKEVPNRLLKRWAASRKAHGALTLDDLIEIAQLSDAQLDSREMAEGVWLCFGLEEWAVASHPRLRHHLRFLGGLAPAHRQEALSARGLAFARMPLAQQQGFLSLAVDRDDPQMPRLEELSDASLRAAYTLPGEFQWVRPGAGESPIGESPEPSPVREPSRQAALAAARRIDPRADATQIVPTELDLVFSYTVTATKRRVVAFR